MARKKRDGVFLRGEVYWYRDPFTGKQTSSGSRLQYVALEELVARKRLAADASYAAAAKENLGYWVASTIAMKKTSGSPKTVEFYTQKLSPKSGPNKYKDSMTKPIYVLITRQTGSGHVYVEPILWDRNLKRRTRGFDARRGTLGAVGTWCLAGAPDYRMRQREAPQ